MRCVLQSSGQVIGERAYCVNESRTIRICNHASFSHMPTGWRRRTQTAQSGGNTQTARLASAAWWLMVSNNHNLHKSDIFIVACVFNNQFNPLIMYVHKYDGNHDDARENFKFTTHDECAACVHRQRRVVFCTASIFCAWWAVFALKIYYTIYVASATAQRSGGFDIHFLCARHYA